MGTFGTLSVVNGIPHTNTHRDGRPQQHHNPTVLHFITFTCLQNQRDIQIICMGHYYGPQIKQGGAESEKKEVRRNEKNNKDLRPTART